MDAWCGGGGCGCVVGVVVWGVGWLVMMWFVMVLEWLLGVIINK